jgi:hypothetical protein
MAMIEATVEGLAMDMATNSPVVILSPIGIDKVLPIWIGHAEAWSIAMQLSGVTSKRPLTYDLLKRVIEIAELRVERVEITDLREQTYYARIRLTDDDSMVEIDARPSDSIALALKTEARIFINEDLLNQEIGDVGSAEEAPMPTDPESLRERLKRINPEDFGKYSL